MFKRKKGPKKASYVNLHNAAVVRFQKSSRIFIWAAVINFLGLIIGHVQFLSGNTKSVPFYFCYGVSNFTLNMFLFEAKMDLTVVIILAYVFAFILSLVTAWMGVMASQAKKKFLFACIGFYFVDWIFVLLTFFVANETWSGLLFNGGIHVIITFFLIMALYSYYQVINLEKRFVKPVDKKEEEEKDISMGEKENGNN